METSRSEESANPAHAATNTIRHAATPTYSKTKRGAIDVFDFRNTPLRDVLQILSQLTGRNVVATPEVQELPISIYLRDVEPMLALEVLAKNYNLWFTESERVVRVMKVEEYGRELTLRRDEKSRVFNLKYASCITVALAIASIFGERVEYVAPEEITSYGHVGTDAFPSVGRDPDTVKEFKDPNIEDFKKRKKDELLERGGIALDEDEIARLGEILRTRADAAADDLLERQIGRARALMTVFPRNNALLIRAVDSKLVEDIGALIEEVDTPTREVLLETKILRISLDDSEESYFSLDVTLGDENAYLDEQGNIVGDSFGRAGSMGSALLSSPATFAFSYIDSKVRAELQMLERQGRINEISTPLVFVANNAAAKFFQGDATPVRTGYTVTEAQYNDEGVQVAPAQVRVNYREEEVGVRLEVSPSINEDRTVTLKIITEISSLQTGQGPPFLFSLGGQTIEGKTDSISKTEVEDIIVAKDNQSIVIGGLIEEVDNEVVERVPILGNIPLIGFLFRDVEIQKRRSEIIFLITPRIVMDPEEAGTLKQRVMHNLSSHPYYTQDVEHIMDYDMNTNELEPTVNMASRRPYFPFNVSKAIRNLEQGSRRSGAMIEIGM
ncbi:type II secretion system protein GspD [Oceanidesulfovibrio indonesiensis]|uniref:type II secretion system protein GspD n=1 Tax=Oceanidesulfovibrio indonesiensis TaxID=54767 RepID=UPI0014316A96|nr:type II secretion system protein GspD [Oceanidesulfovibrio indonesiensis]